MKKTTKKVNPKSNKEVLTIKNVTTKKVKGNKLSKKIKLHLLGLLILLALVGGCFYKFGIVAIVNGKPIYRLSYLRELQKSDTTVLNSLIQKSLIENVAKSKGVVIQQSEIDETLKTIETQIISQGTTLEEALKSENMTKEDLMDQIRTQKIAEKLASPSAEPTQQEIDTFLKENKDYLSKTATKEELKTLAITQLKNQAQSTAINTWFNDLKTGAKIIYR